MLGGNSQGCGPPLKGLWSQLVGARGPCGGLGSDTCAGLVRLPTKGQAGWSACEALIHGAEGRPELRQRGRQAEGGHGKGTHGRMVLESRSAVSGAQRLGNHGGPVESFYFNLPWGARVQERFFLEGDKTRYREALAVGASLDHGGGGLSRKEPEDLTESVGQG